MTGRAKLFPLDRDLKGYDAPFLERPGRLPLWQGALDLRRGYEAPFLVRPGSLRQPDVCKP